MILFLGIFVASIYYSVKLLSQYLNGNNDYWPKLGVPHALLTEFASYYEFITGKKKFQDLDLYYYNKDKEAPFLGIMELRNPVLFVRDLELVKKIMIKDVEYFLHRRQFPLGSDAEQSEMFLFNMHGQKWKDLRAAMSPTFSTGKIRHMFDHFHRSSQSLVHHIKENNTIERGQSGKSLTIDLRDAYERYMMDVVASTAFGMDGKSFADENSVFMKMGKKFINFGLYRTIKMFIVFFLPGIARYFNVNIIDTSSLDFFRKIALQTIRRRRATNTIDQYPDVLSIMMKTTAESSGNFKITDDHIAANSMAFFLAGFDQTESILSFATYHMATNPELQRKVYAEIQSVVTESGGEITYDALNKMTYLDMFMTETTRMHPPAPRTERKASKDYKVPDSDLVIKEGTNVVIPIIGFHRDERYFPEPEKFDPERFSNESKQNRPQLAYMAFGQGPRNCIGMRYSLIATKAAMAQLVHNFEIVPCKGTMIPLKFEDCSGVIKPAAGLRVGFKPRS